MSLNTYPYNQFPASTDKLDEAHNAELQREVDQLKSGLTDLSTILNKIVVKSLSSGSSSQVSIDFVRYGRAFFAIDTRGTNGANGWATLAGVLSMGYIGSDFKYVPIKTHENYTLEITWDGDNNKYIVKEKKIADNTYGGYLQGLVVLAKS